PWPPQQQVRGGWRPVRIHHHPPTSAAGTATGSRGISDGSLDPHRWLPGPLGVWRFPPIGPRRGHEGLPGLSWGIPGIAAPSGALSRRSVQHGGAWRGPCHSCSAARAPWGRLRPLPALPGGGYRIPGHARAGWDMGGLREPETPGQGSARWG
ncbi:hypothetical protein Nmel_000014, partial [Mimus melanotis]